MRSFLSVVAAVTLCAAPATAQSLSASRAFANVNFGFQSQSQDVSQAGQFPLYDETGTFEASHSLEGGAFFDIGGGYEILRNISIGASFTQRSKSTRDATVTARVPHPVFFDTLRDASGIASGLEHTERAFHFAAIWHMPVTVEFEVMLFAGPSFFNVKDELIESVTTSEVGGDFSQVNLDTIAVSTQKHTAAGFNLGIDTRYMFNRNVSFIRNVGVGAMLRYTHGSVTLTSPTGGDDIKTDAGGLEIAGGLRFKF